jgi:hypothetical protein
MSHVPYPAHSSKLNMQASTIRHPRCRDWSKPSTEWAKDDGRLAYDNGIHASDACGRETWAPPRATSHSRAVLGLQRGAGPTRRNGSLHGPQGMLYRTYSTTCIHTYVLRNAPTKPQRSSRTSGRRHAMSRRPKNKGKPHALPAVVGLPPRASLSCTF